MIRLHTLGKLAGARPGPTGTLRRGSRHSRWRPTGPPRLGSVIRTRAEVRGVLITLEQ